MNNAAGTLDVRVDMNTLDIDENLDINSLPSRMLLHNNEAQLVNHSLTRGLLNEVCLSTELFAAFLTVVTLFLVIISALTSSLYIRRRAESKN
jgi:hypothetical protein